MSGEVLRVLVVDDSPDDRAEARCLLLKGEARRYRFEEAETGAAAIRRCRDAEAGAPSCMLLDYDLPDMDAAEVIASLSDSAGLPICPIVVMTGSDSDELGRVALRAGAQDFLGKSWMTSEVLSRAVENATERWALARALHDQRERLRESERRFRAVAAVAPVGIFRTDLAGSTVYVNERWLQIAGLDATRAMGAGWASAVHPDDRDEVVMRWAEAVRARRPFAAEYRFLAPGGKVTWVIGEAVPETDETDERTGYVGTITDITERKRSEEALGESDRKKDEFLATLAHELRNPLAPIRTGLEIMKRSPGDGLVSARALNMMDRQLGHMIRIVDDLLDVSRISRGSVELKKERIPLGVIVDHAVEVSQPLIEAGGHTLAVSVPDRPIWIDGDLTRLAQVVGNLLTNSAKYTPRGGRIEVFARVDGEDAVLGVVDDGTGIAPEMLPRIFDLFTQLERTLDRAQGGLGIGLSLVKKLVELHGGSVRAASPGLGLGSTFTVRLPLARPLERPAAAAAVGPEPAAPPAHRRVLVVDDNVDAAEMLATILDLAGHQTMTAHTGPEALSVARDFHPEIVLLDIGLPGMDGYEVSRRFRADPALRATVLVALTGWGSQDDQRRSKEAGFDFHLTKPVQAGELAAVLGRAP